MMSSYCSTCPPKSILNYIQFPKIISVLLFLFASLDVSAEKPNWVPVAELLIGSMGKMDAHQMSEVMHRCSALNMTLASLLSDDSPERSKGFQSQALHMIQNGILIETNLEKERTGLEPDIDIHSGIAIGSVKKMLVVYNGWIDDNYETSGSYFDKDFQTEMKGCELASKLIRQISNN